VAPLTVDPELPEAAGQLDHSQRGQADQVETKTGPAADDKSGRGDNREQQTGLQQHRHSVDRRPILPMVSCQD
jgi:hypothetical protein